MLLQKQCRHVLTVVQGVQKHCTTMGNYKYMHNYKYMYGSIQSTRTSAWMVCNFCWRFVLVWICCARICKDIMSLDSSAVITSHSFTSSNWVAQNHQLACRLRGGRSRTRVPIISYNGCRDHDHAYIVTRGSTPDSSWGALAIERLSKEWQMGLVWRTKSWLWCCLSWRSAAPTSAWATEPLGQLSGLSVRCPRCTTSWPSTGD